MYLLYIFYIIYIESIRSISKHIYTHTILQYDQRVPYNITNYKIQYILFPIPIYINNHISWNLALFSGFKKNQNLHILILNNIDNNYNRISLKNIILDSLCWLLYTIPRKRNFSFCNKNNNKGNLNSNLNLNKIGITELFLNVDLPIIEKINNIYNIFDNFKNNNNVNIYKLVANALYTIELTRIICKYISDGFDMVIIYIYILY